MALTAVSSASSPPLPVVFNDFDGRLVLVLAAAIEAHGVKVLDVELVVPPSIKLASSRDLEHLDAYDDTSYVISVKQRRLDPDKIFRVLVTLGS